jgi:hypothetical protein
MTLIDIKGDKPSVGGRSLGLYIRLISCVCLEVEGVFDQRSDLVGITREEVW